VNWRKIKAEYIAGGISQRALAEKYGVNRNLLMRIANREKWKAKRDKAEAKALERVEQKTAEAVADNAVLIEKIKTGLLQRLVGMVIDYPDKNAAEIKKKENGALLIYRMKDIAAVLAVLEDKSQRGQTADMEDLSPLAELLRDE
jgi:transcriptional regulator with XRE-family HTH domain